MTKTKEEVSVYTHPGQPKTELQPVTLPPQRIGRCPATLPRDTAPKKKEEREREKEAGVPFKSTVLPNLHCYTKGPQTTLRTLANPPKTSYSQTKSHTTHQAREGRSSLRAETT